MASYLRYIPTKITSYQRPTFHSTTPDHWTPGRQTKHRRKTRLPQISILMRSTSEKSP